MIGDEGGKLSGWGLYLSGMGSPGECGGGSKEVIGFAGGQPTTGQGWKQEPGEEVGQAVQVRGCAHEGKLQSKCWGSKGGFPEDVVGHELRL